MPETRIIPIELVSVAEVTNIRAAVKAETSEPAEVVKEAELKILDETAPPVPDEEIEDILPPENQEPEEPAFNLDKLASMIDSIGHV